MNNVDRVFLGFILSLFIYGLVATSYVRYRSTPINADRVCVDSYLFVRQVDKSTGTVSLTQVTDKGSAVRCPQEES